MRQFRKSIPTNIAIVRRNGLGDLLLTIPLMHALKSLSEKTRLTLFLDERNAPLLPYLPKIFDQAVIIPKRGNKYFTLLNTARKYRKEKFDIALSSKTSPMKLMDLFLFTLGAKKRIAYVHQNGLTRHLINQKIFFDKERANSIHQSLKALRLVGYETLPDIWRPKIEIPMEMKARYPSPFKQGDKRPVLFLSASTTNDKNRIHPKKYSEIVNQLYSHCPFSLLLMGEKRDADRLFHISRLLSFPHVCVYPRNFDEFIVLQSYCDLYFGPDGGSAHIGAALQRKQVVLFGSTNPILWAPLSEETLCLYHQDHADQIADVDIYEALFSKLR